MLKRLGFAELHKAIADKIETKTGLRCYDVVPDDASIPFYFLQIAETRQENTKTMYGDVFQVLVHAIADSSKSSDQIYDAIHKLKEALTEKIVLEHFFKIIRQSDLGLKSLQTEKTNQKHAVLIYEFKVCYEFKSKT